MFHEVCNELYPYKEAFNMIELLTVSFLHYSACVCVG